MVLRFIYLWNNIIAQNTHYIEKINPKKVEQSKSTLKLYIENFQTG